MITKWLIAQALSLIGMVNVFAMIIMIEELPRPVLKISLLISAGFFTLGAMLIVLFSVQFYRKVTFVGRRMSSILSPFYRFLFPNVVIAMVLILLILAVKEDAKFVNSSLVLLLFAGYPTILMATSVFVLSHNNQLLISDYNKAPVVVPLTSLIGIDSFLFGFAYSLKYRRDDGKIVRIYFFPRGGIFSEVDVIGDLRAIVDKQSKGD